MNTYRIAQKGDTHQAINIDENGGIVTVLSLRNQGYRIVPHLFEANSAEEAIQAYHLLHSPIESNQRYPHSEDTPETQGYLWDIFCIIFVLAMIIAAEL